MSCVFKATIENKKTSVTTHFKEINKEQRVYCLSYCTVISSRSIVLASCTDVCGRTARRHTLPGTHRLTCGVRTSRSSSLTSGPQTARTWIQSIALFGVPSTDGLSTSTIHDNQPAEAGNRHWVGQTIAAFHRSRHWSVASPAWGLSRSKANKLNIWCKNCSMWVTHTSLFTEIGSI